MITVWKGLSKLLVSGHQQLLGFEGAVGKLKV